MFNEDNTIEQLLIQTIKKNGFTYIPAEDLKRDFNDVLVEGMVKDALIKLNPEIKEEPDRADEVIHRLRTVVLSAQPHNLVASNEQLKKLFFENNSYPFGEDGKMVSIRFFDYDDITNNQFVVTNQWVFPQEMGGKRLDIVVLVNGFPLIIGECKTPVRAAITWADGASDILDYEKSIPQMFVPNVFSFATEGKCYRYGGINMPIPLWGPWHTPDNKSEGTLADVARSVAAMIRPEVVLDILQYFTMFATDKKFRKIKIVCRYQQYEGANMIVDRVRAGYPKKGLIWHFQGSGKSLLMVFAAQKLRMCKNLKNPTVVIVDDRIDLEDQITATFNASDIPNLYSAPSKQDLIGFFKQDIRKIMITTIFKFGEVDGVLNERDNIIVMVDEAHRTQEGNLGEKMRQALPNAFFFGLTGTPINRADKNTFHTFGATEDRSGYMSKYSFSDSIRDGATLPLHFEAVPVELHVNQELVDAAFDDMTKDLSKLDKAELAKRVKIEAIMKAPDRIKAVCEHIANHYTTKVEPNGFKAQVVCYDRECCVLYKKELDQLLGEQASTIVMHTAGDKADKFKEWKRDRDEESKVLDRFRDPADPLKIVIVTSKLLTGFDAPILQTMYLDKPMKDHTLLQAICRTNRLYGQTKSHGLIVDYIGIFDNVAHAFEFDEKSMLQVVTNIEGLKKDLPIWMDKCLGYFNGVDRTIEGFEGLMAAQDCLPTSKEKDAFASDFNVLTRAWEALSPDPFLSRYKYDYVWLSKVYESVKPISGQGKLIWMALGAKTIDLVHQNITVEAVRDDLDILVMNAEVIDEFLSTPGDTKKKAKEVEIKLVARLNKHKNDPKFQKLGERLEELRLRHEQGLIQSVDFLKMLLQLAKDTLDAEKQVDPVEEQNKAKAALSELFAGVKTENTPVIVERIVEDIDEIVKVVRFEGWQDTDAGRQEVTKALRKIIYLKYKIKDNELFDKAYNYVEMYY